MLSWRSLSKRSKRFAGIRPTSLLANGRALRRYPAHIVVGERARVDHAQRRPKHVVVLAADANVWPSKPLANRSRVLEVSPRKRSRNELPLKPLRELGIEHRVWRGSGGWHLDWAA